MSNDCRYIYPINLPNLARLVSERKIDLAPTRLAWERIARDIADAEGEDGREAFHIIASVWPDYSRHDSEQCFNRAVARRDPSQQACRYLRWVCKKAGINLDTPALRGGKPTVARPPRNSQATVKVPVPVDRFYFMQSQMQGREILGKNYLTDLLLRLYPRHDLLNVLNDYCVGFDSLVHGTVAGPLIYWQIDENKNLINGKRMQYLSDGHRDKSDPPILLYRTNPTCLFGLHLIERHDTIAVVESEKTCIIMSLEVTDRTWMALGGLNFLTEQMLVPIKHKNILLYPDLDLENDRKLHKSKTYALWWRKAQALSRQGFKIAVSDFLEDHASTYDRLQKHDIADFFMNDRILRKISPKE